MVTNIVEHEFFHPMRVYIEDTDAGGIVYYVNYLKFMERARTEFLRTLGLPKPAILEEGKILVVASVNIDYKKSARLDNELKVTAKLAKVARSYMIFDQKIYCEEQCLVDAQVKVACVVKESMRPCPFPERVAKLIQ